MKRVTKITAAIAFSLFLGLATPAVAQSTDAGTTTDMRADDDDDMGKWGLAGLAGLLGLLGLRRREDDRRTTNTSARRD